MTSRLRTMLVLSIAVWLAASLVGQAQAFWQGRISGEAPASQPRERLVDEDTGDVVPPEPEQKPAPVMVSSTFDDLVLGSSRNTLDTAIDRLETLLQSKVEGIARECRLTDDQKKRLLLAGRGDIKRLVERILLARKPYVSIDSRDADQQTHQELRDVTAPLQTSVRAGPFGEDSILAKVLRKDLPPSVFEAFITAEEFQRWGGQITIEVRDGVEFRDVIASRAAVNDGRIARLAAIPNLRSLNAELTNFTPDGLAALGALTSLEVIDLSRTRIGSDGIEHLARLPNLQIVLLRNTLVGDPGLQHLGKAARLRELHLQGTTITDAGLGHLKGLAHLELFNVGRTRITDAGLIALDLPGLAQLKELGLSQTRIGDAGFSLIGKCDRLERLIAIGTQASDTAIRPLRNLKNLRHLLLDQTPVTDEGLAVLAEIPSLETLELSTTTVSDVGLFKLRNLKNLKYLNLASTAVTDDGISEFHRALPDVVVHH